MRTNERGIALIKEFESLQLEAYKCPAGIFTIGWGHTQGVKRGDVIDIDTAEKFLRQDIEVAERGVNTLVAAKLNDNQFSALVSFVFNLGSGKLKTSTLLKVINDNPNSPVIDKQLKRWVYANGEKLAGLVRRRKAESELYYS